MFDISEQPDRTPAENYFLEAMPEHLKINFKGRIFRAANELQKNIREKFQPEEPVEVPEFPENMDDMEKLEFLVGTDKGDIRLTWYQTETTDPRAYEIVKQGDMVFSIGKLEETGDNSTNWNLYLSGGIEAIPLWSRGDDLEKMWTEEKRVVVKNSDPYLDEEVRNLFFKISDIVVNKPEQVKRLSWVNKRLDNTIDRPTGGGIKIVFKERRPSFRTQDVPVPL